MIIGKSYIFLHVPKTGGTWIRNALRLTGSIDQEFKDHRHFNTLPDEIKNSHRRVFAFVRNPWDWYLSLYSHYHHNFERNIHEFRGPHRAWLIERFGGSFQQMLEHMQDKDSLTTALENISEGCGNITIFRYEDGLADCLLRFLGEEINPTISKRLREMSSSRFNAHFQHRSEAMRYTPELSLLVMDREAPISNRFGYLPPCKVD